MKGLYKLFIVWFFVLGWMPSMFGQDALEVTVGSGTGSTNGGFFPTNIYYKYSWTYS